MRLLLLFFIFASSNLFAGFDHCRLRAIDGDPPFYINVCSTPHGEMRVEDYFRYLDEGLRANVEFKVIDERDFLPEEDYPSRPSEIDPAQLSETLRSIAKLGRVSDSEEMLRSREREDNIHSVNERVRRINEARDWLERERSSANDLQGVQSLRAQLKDPNPIIRVGAVSLMEAQRSQKKFSGEFGKGHRALKEKFKAVRAEDIKSYKLVGSSAQTFLRSEKEFETGDKNFASELLSLSESLLDVGLGLAPGSSLVKDTYELIFGTNMVTGAELSPLDRGVSLVGVGVGIASFGTAGGVATSLLRSQKLVKLADHFSAVSSKFLKTPKSVFDQALGVGERVVEAAGKLGFGKATQLGEFIKSSTGKTWADVQASGRVLKDKAFKLFRKDVPLGNEMPSNGIYARVVDKDYVEKIKSGEAYFSLPNDGNEAFVAAFDDIKDITNPKDFAERLSLFTDEAGTVLKDTSNYQVLKFKFKNEIAQSLRTPFELLDKRGFGFFPGGKTKGGVREWLIDNDAVKKGYVEFID
jgi:hypothetical protein